jgi:Xaa-Pro aminopeptidase
MRAAFRASKAAIKEVIRKAKPGMSETQCVGIAQAALYENGAEYEGHPLYFFVGKKTTNAISRPSPNCKIKKGVPIQLNIGGRVGGYSSSIGRILFFGTMPKKMKDFMEAGLEAEEYLLSVTRAGVPAKEVALKYVDFVQKMGYGKYLLYGPYHGLGLLECEYPWVETSSSYTLQQNMTFQADVYWHTKTYGARWEDGIVVKKNGVEVLDDFPRKIYLKK